MDLNPAQRRAADADDRPLLIVAGAGTGKTQTLAHRVAALIRDPEQSNRTVAHATRVSEWLVERVRIELEYEGIIARHRRRKMEGRQEVICHVDLSLAPLLITVKCPIELIGEVLNCIVASMRPICRL